MFTDFCECLLTFQNVCWLFNNITSSSWDRVKIFKSQLCTQLTEESECTASVRIFECRMSLRIFTSAARHEIAWKFWKVSSILNLQILTSIELPFEIFQLVMRSRENSEESALHSFSLVNSVWSWLSVKWVARQLSENEYRAEFWEFLAGDFAAIGNYSTSVLGQGFPASGEWDSCVCVAVCCSELVVCVLQCVAVCCSVLGYPASGE